MTLPEIIVDLSVIPKGEHFRVYAEFTVIETGAFIDPDANKSTITVYDIDWNVEIAGTDMTKMETGKYEYYISTTTLDKGQYYWEMVAAFSTHNLVRRGVVFVA